ncbi:MAG TPA: CBS domain-containing protein [Methanocorpusculum sp.]|nr:CBS domain-containing protein [Methanocorpusculum sp.]
MSTDVTCLEASGVVKEVIAAIRKTGHDGFPVLNDGKVVGLIAARDIVGKKASDQIAPLMETLVFRAHPEDSMTDVARKMFRFCIQKMPVVDSDGKFTGILTNADVIRSQIERVTPEKVYEFIQTLKTLYGVEPVLSRGMVEVKKLVPTQGKVYRDEFEGRMYEIEKHLAEPVVVVRRAGKLILIDGHHRAVAASRMGAEQLDAYLIDVNLDSELGIEKTARSQRLWGINDIKILEESRCSIL